eukprot:762727-Hanusia_phi.AAC.5
MEHGIDGKESRGRRRGATTADRETRCLRASRTSGMAPRTAMEEARNIRNGFQIPSSGNDVNE